MSVSRRRFLQHGVLTAAACAAIPFEGWAAANNRAGDKNTSEPRNDLPPMSPRGQGDALEHLHRDSFADLIGTGFKVSGGGNTDAVWLRLLSINDFTPAPVDTGSMAVPPPRTVNQTTTTVFGLVFLGSSSQPLKQDTYVFEHIKLGTFKLFIVPGGQGQDTYTAVINRLDVVQSLTGGGAQTSVPVTPTPMPMSTPAAVVTPAAVAAPGAPTSSGNASPSPERAEIPAVQRGATRD